MNARALSLFITILLLAASAGGAQAPAGTTKARVLAVAGCYELTVSEWSPVDVNAAYHRIPRLIRLDTIPAALSRGWVLTPNIAYPHHGAMPGTPSWNVAGDTLRLLWSNGFQPTVVTLVGRDSLWTGEAIAESDAHPLPPAPLPRAQVAAHRSRCR